MRNRFVLFALAAAVVASGLACGDSDDTPLGSEFVGGLLGSTPGTVFEDSFPTAEGDTSYSFSSTIDEAGYLDVGVSKVGDAVRYERTILLRADFSGAGSDTARVVAQAFLRLTGMDNDDFVPEIEARFVRLGTRYDEGDTVAVLDTTGVIPGEGGAAIRKLKKGELAYELPAALVQGWIRGDSTNSGLAIVYAGAGEELLGFYSRQANVEGKDPPSIQVIFTDDVRSNYLMAADGIYTRPTSTTTHLVVSDGFVRRIHLPVDLGGIEDSAAVHEARLALTYVPGSVAGVSQSVLLYMPLSADPASEDFDKGQLIVEQTLDEGAGVLELPITNVLLAILSGQLENTGFVLRFESENTEVRQAEFYTGADSTRGPRVFVTYSTPAELEE